MRLLVEPKVFLHTGEFSIFLLELM